MKKLKEHTYGRHIYMEIELDNGQTAEIDVFLRDDGKESYFTSADCDIRPDVPQEKKEEAVKLRQTIIDAFCELY